MGTSATFVYESFLQSRLSVLIANGDIFDHIMTNGNVRHLYYNIAITSCRQVNVKHNNLKFDNVY